MLNKEQENMVSSDEEVVQMIQANNSTLLNLIERLKKIANNTLIEDKKNKVEALRASLLEKDLEHQLFKMKMMNDVLNELE